MADSSELLCVIASIYTTIIAYETLLQMVPERINVKIDFSFYRVWLFIPLIYFVPNISYKLYKKISKLY